MDLDSYKCPDKLVVLSWERTLVMVSLEGSFPAIGHFIYIHS
jgi:hypothetical protein